MIEAENTSTPEQQQDDKFHEIMEAIVNLFREESTKNQVFSILGDSEKTIDNMIKASASHVIINYFEVDYPGENKEDKAASLFTELKTLFGDTITDEITIQEKVMHYRTEIFELLVNTPRIKKKVKQRQILSEFEDDLIEILRTFPEFYFFDFLQSLMDIKKVVQFKEIPVEENIIVDEKDARSKDMFSFNAFRKSIIELLNIGKLRDLELLYQPIRKLSETVFDQNIEVLPISNRGIECFHDANELRNVILEVFRDSNDARESLDGIESKIRGKIFDELKKHAEISPNDVLYFLQYLLSASFTDMVNLLEANGIEDLTLFTDALTTDISKLEYRLSEKGIDEDAIDELLKYEGNMTSYVRISLDDFKKIQKGKGMSSEILQELTIQRIIENYMSDIETPALEFVAKDLHLTPSELIDLLMLEVNIKGIIKDMGLRSMNHMIMLFKMQLFNDNITKEVFLTVLMELTRHIARIIEFFVLLNETKKGLITNANKMRGIGISKPWEQVTTQDIFITKIMTLQDDVAYILDKNSPNEVNAFIHGKLCQLTYDDALKEIQEGESPIYFGITERSIVLEELDLISEVSALDLMFRFLEKHL